MFIKFPIPKKADIRKRIFNQVGTDTLVFHKINMKNK